MNVRSINFHFEELQVIVALFKVITVAICLTETWGKQVDDTDILLLKNTKSPYIYLELKKVATSLYISTKTTL